MKRSLTTFLLLLMAFSGVLEARAQWPRGQGKGYAQVSLGRAVATEGFDADRNLNPLGAPGNPEEYRENAVYAYLEYGLTHRLTLIASTYAKDISDETQLATFETNGLADLTVLLRYTAVQVGPVVVSPQAGLKLPTGYDASDAPPLGSGKVDVLVNTAVGVSLYPFPGYMGMGFGVNFRGGLPQDEYRGYLEGGVSLGSVVLLRGRADLIESTTNRSSVFSMLTQLPEQGYLNAGPGLSLLASPHWQLHADARWTVAGRATAQLFNAIVGVAYVW